MKAKNSSQKVSKKAIDTYKDPYLPKEGLHDMAVCKKCSAIYYNKRWSIAGVPYKKTKENKKTMLVLCPACRKIRDGYAEGFVTLKGDYLKEHKQDILNLVKNEEERAVGYNPLERIIALKDRGSIVEITTTNEKLAQRIGKKVQKDRVTRVVWER
jgi:hypothetical protein